MKKIFSCYIDILEMTVENRNRLQLIDEKRQEICGTLLDI